MFNLIPRALRRLRKDESGNAAMELMFAVPMIFAAILLTLVAFNYYRTQARDTRAAYAVADVISRETDNINPAFMTTIKNLHQFLSGNPDGAAIRISVVDWNPKRKTYRIRWRKARNSGNVTLPRLSVARLTPHLPVLSDYEAIIVVETFTNYRHASQVPLPPMTFKNVTVARPRNGPQVCWTDSSDPKSISKRC